MNRPKRIVISGYYGFSNVGDEAILLSLHRALQRVMPDVELTVLSANPEKTVEEHGLQAIPRLGMWQLWRKLKQTDLLISGGGSLFQDGTSTRSLYYYLGILAIGLISRTPTMIYAQGIGPLYKRFNRWLTGTVLNRVSLITVRDKQSLTELERLGVEGVRAELTADPVLALEQEDKQEGLHLLKEIGLIDGDEVGANGQSEAGPIIGISIRPWEGADHLIEQLSAVISRLVAERQARVVLIPMHYPGDDQITERLRLHLGEPQAVRVLPKGCHAQQMISLMGSLNLLIGVRLHALVFAAIASTPAIAISYDPKVDHFAQRMEQVCAGSIAEASAERIYEEACRLLDNEAAIRQRAAHLSSELRKEALRSAELAAGLLNS